ncbi:hypothetical protein [Paraburkholderia saeva]|uniref:hypothetical protein n=1 Tax=Paraburkholderia saeva TaxID=2777537 RepID=UPI001D507BD6|nr:hypothetical protein [Paraburkholderia saeva]CAG4902363.1 hypothetical protein R70241_02957 [Paraburkholderia saeva]
MTGRPPPDARAQLDEYIKILTRLGDGLSINDFRREAIAEAARTNARVKAFVCWGSVIFLALMIAELAIPVFMTGPVHRFSVLLIVLWSFSLGGLGAVANAFLHLLKLVPQQTLNTSDFFEVVGRTMLGCLFSTVLSLTLFPEIGQFLESLTAAAGKPDKTAGLTALVPFLLGYSIPLVLRLLDKTIQAVELTFGAEDRRTMTNSPRAGRPPGRRR